MNKKPISYQVSMEKIEEFIKGGKKKFFKKPDFTRFLDPDYRNYVIRRIIIYLSLSAFCVAFLLLLSASTSPLYNWYIEGDSSIFIFIGKAIHMGKNVYTDYFDHKGPLLFYLNALGYSLTGSKTGIFIIQCIVLSLSAIFMYKTARIFTKTARAIICVLISILAFASTISDGNMSEEYCMLFCLISIFLSVKFYTKTPDKAHNPKYMFIYGICFAICAFIRINNGIMIGGIVLISIVTDFVSERVQEAGKNILYFIAGMVVVFVPVCLFFIIKGTFSDMIFATFTFNLLYASEGASIKASSTLSGIIKWTMPAMALIVVSLIFAKRLGAKVASLITAISVFALIPVMMGFGYTHYYTTLIPLITLYASAFFFIAGNRVNVLSLLLCIAMALPLGGYFETLPYNVSHYYGKIYEQNNPSTSRNSYSDTYYSAKKLSALIPDSEKDSVFGYNVSSAWFLYADIMPCFKLFTLQEEWAMHYPEFGRQINQMMIDSPPKWVIVHNIDIIKSSQFLNLLDENYEFTDENGYDLLYRLKEES
ncbi:MAG: glycosyltransferase family 39 protein [Oscillospiraceae bacterium]|nr:glycosyltransferase family 39 protein [Oscillospiraceae bacterium]